jgi:magnesium-transporting ATPase (P-type)
MIRAANVGVGLKGEEGLQAYNVCDYGIHQFRFLATLLLCHGRWNYRRLAMLILYMFYKNVVIVMPQYYANMTSNFSGQKLYHDAFYQTYNVFFTSLPIMVFGLFDKDLDREHSFKFPQAYVLGQRRFHLSVRIFLEWCVNGAWHSVVIFVFAYFSFSNGNLPTTDGKASDLWLFGSLVFLLIVIVVNLKILLMSEYITWVLWFTLFLMMGAWLLMEMWVSFVGGISYECYGQLPRLFGTLLFPIVTFVTCVVALTRDMQWKAYCNVYKPALSQIDSASSGSSKTSSSKDGRILVGPPRVEPVPQN